MIKSKDFEEQMIRIYNNFTLNMFKQGIMFNFMGLSAVEGDRPVIKKGGAMPLLFTISFNTIEKLLTSSESVMLAK